jgi:phage pi2 protein 07
MKNFKLFLIFCISIILTSCNNSSATKENSANADSSQSILTNKSDNEENQKKKDFLSFPDLKKLVTIDNLNKETIVAFLKENDDSWQYEGTDNKAIYFSKNNDEASKGIITYYFKYHAIEYTIFRKNQFFNISKNIKNENYTLTTSNENQYGGARTTYSSNEFVIVMEEVPLTTPGDSGFKILIAQKR